MYSASCTSVRMDGTRGFLRNERIASMPPIRASAPGIVGMSPPPPPPPSRVRMRLTECAPHVEACRDERVGCPERGHRVARHLDAPRELAVLLVGRSRRVRAESERGALGDERRRPPARYHRADTRP